MLMMYFYIDNINGCVMCVYFRVLEDCALYLMVSVSS